MEFTWNEPNPVPKKCVETGGSNEKEENKETEVAWVKNEVKSPELQEKLKAEARSSLHLKKVRFLPTKYCKKKNSKSSSDFLNECVHKWHFAKSHCWWVPRDGISRISGFQIVSQITRCKITLLGEHIQNMPRTEWLRTQRLPLTPSAGLSSAQNRTYDNQLTLHRFHTFGALYFLFHNFFVNQN